MRAIAGIAFLAVSFALTGCSMLRGLPSIRVGENRVEGPKDAGKPATLSESKSGESVVIPAGSRVTVTETEAVPATDKEAGKPAVKVTEVVPSAPMQWEKKETKVDANTGTVDTSIAKKRIEAEERRPLLYVAIGLGVAGVVMLVVLKEWPAVGKGCLLAGALAGIAWKVAEMPWWVFLLGIGGTGLLVLGYKRAEWDADGDGVADFLETKPKGKDAQT